MLDSFRSQPVRVFNLAPEDLFLWKKLAGSQLPSTQIISTNLSPRSASAPQPDRYAIIEIAAEELATSRPLRIGFLGLSDPALVKPNSNFSSVHPLKAVQEVKAEVLKKADFLVVLGDISRETAAQLALQHPEIRAVLIAERHFVLNPPEEVNNAVILNSVERGRYLGRLTLDIGTSGKVTGHEADFIELGELVPEDPELLRRQGQLTGH